MRANTHKKINKETHMCVCVYEWIENGGQNSNNNSINELWKDWNTKIYNYATWIYFQIPNRINTYLQTDLSKIQIPFVKFVGLLTYAIGFTEVNIDLNILSDLQSKANTIMSLGVVLDLVVFILIVLRYFYMYNFNAIFLILCVSMCMCVHVCVRVCVMCVMACMSF